MLRKEGMREVHLLYDSIAKQFMSLYKQTNIVVDLKRKKEYFEK